MDEETIDFLEKNQICYDRFTFDKIMRFLLVKEYTHDDAKDTILFNCVLSGLVLQERIHNQYYEKISVEQVIADDLAKLRDEIFSKHLEATINRLIIKKKNNRRLN